MTMMKWYLPWRSNHQVQILIIWEANDMDGDQADHESSAAIEHVEKENDTDVDIEDRPKAGPEENIEDEGAIDKETESTKHNMDRNVVNHLQHNWTHKH